MLFRSQVEPSSTQAEPSSSPQEEPQSQEEEQTEEQPLSPQQLDQGQEGE